jgi:heat shock protein HspQ
MIRANYDVAPLFQPGQLVRHKRYGYRGVVVDYDLTCQASDEWYQSNQTQPEPKQPWYHVLVDQSDATTYPAQSSLKIDGNTEPITHPLTEYFFSHFANGRYTRNAQPWPR